MTPFALLQNLAAANETGILFVRTQEGHQVRIGLSDGRVAHLSYALRRGGEALARLSGTTAVSASFTRGLPAERHDDLPPPDLLLQVLATALGSGTASAPSPGPSTVPTRGEPTAPAPASRAHPESGAARSRPDDPRRAAALEQLRRLMIDYVGPIGGLLVEQEAAAGFRTWTELVDRLAREVSPDAEAHAFRQAALRLTR